MVSGVTNPIKDMAENGHKQVELLREPKLSLACGNRKPEGFFGIDLYTEGTDADMSMDLLQFPWPIADRSVKEIECGHFVEHIPHWRPGWEQDGWWLFFSEVFRICKRGAMCRFVHPYAMSDRAFWDPTHTRYIHEATWIYLNREWREREGVNHYVPNINFEIISCDGMGVSNEMQARNLEQQNFARRHYWNTVEDLVVLIKAIK